MLSDRKKIGMTSWFCRSPTSGWLLPLGMGYALTVPAAYNYGMTDLQILRKELLATIRDYGSCAVAFSAGVDSTVVAKAAHLALGDDAIAVTADSPSLASGELQDAKRLAALIGIRHQIIGTQEIADPKYTANNFDRCYYCKSELYSRMIGLTQDWGVNVLVNGANLDDQIDYRPGMRAADENSVRSPLIEAGIGKADVRRLAEAWQLPVWNKPAMPCLSSRVAYGVEVTSERLRMIDQGERWLKQRGWQEVRVRYHEGDLARIEVPIEQLSALLKPDCQRELVEALQQIGFRDVTVDLKGLRSGSLNSVIPVELIEINRSENQAARKTDS